MIARRARKLTTAWRRAVVSDAYEVGYGRPPKASQFKPGQSGNPKGRPRRSRNLKTDLEQELRATVTVREGGREIRVSKQRAMVKGLIAKAVQGEPKAIDKLVDLIDRLLAEREEHQSSAPVTAEEREVIDTLAERFVGPATSDSADDAGSGTSS